jgi:hypothetical protein
MAANVMPDAGVIAREMQNLQQSTANLSAEFGRIGNLPAFHGIQALQQQITALSVAIQNGFQGTTQQHTTLLARLQSIDTKAAARYSFDPFPSKIHQTLRLMLTNREENAIARVHNSYLRQPTDVLLPLVNINDGSPIDVFPASPGAIDGMSSGYILLSSMQIAL